MVRKSIGLIAIILCLGLVITGCPKKQVVKEEPSSQKAGESAAEKAKREAEEKARKEKEAEAARLKEKEEAAKREAARKEAEEKKKFEESLKSKTESGIQGQVAESSMLKDIHFNFDKYDIRPEDTEILKASAAVLQKNPKVKIQIEGHCDERGTSEYNLALGERRANSAKKYLVSLGIPESRISTISYGKEKPLDPAHNEEAWAKNRRDHFIILSK